MARRRLRDSAMAAASGETEGVRRLRRMRWAKRRVLRKVGEEGSGLGVWGFWERRRRTSSWTRSINPQIRRIDNQDLQCHRITETAIERGRVLTPTTTTTVEARGGTAEETIETRIRSIATTLCSVTSARLKRLGASLGEEAISSSS